MVTGVVDVSTDTRGGWCAAAGVGGTLTGSGGETPRKDACLQPHISFIFAFLALLTYTLLVSIDLLVLLLPAL